MTRTLASLLCIIALLASACASADEPQSSVTTQPVAVTTATTPSTVPPSTTVNPTTTTPTEPAPPGSVSHESSVGSGTIAGLGVTHVIDGPEGVVLTDLTTGEPGMVAAAIIPKNPGVHGQQPGLLFWKDRWTTIDLTIPRTSEISGVVWTGLDFVASIQGGGENGVPFLMRSANGTDWTVEPLQVRQLETLGTTIRGLRAALYSPELVQYDGDAGIADMAVTSSGIIAVGWKSLIPGEPRPVVWTSHDGAVWSEEIISDTPEILTRLSVGTTVLALGLSRGPAGGLSPTLYERLPEWTRIPLDMPARVDRGFWNLSAVTSGPAGILATIRDYDGESTWWLRSGDSWTAVTGPTAQQPLRDVRSLFATEAGYVAGGCTGDEAYLVSTTSFERWTSASLGGGCVEILTNRFILVTDPAYSRSQILTFDEPAATPSATWSVVLVDPDDVLNVRSGPGMSYDIVGTLAHDATAITVIGHDGDWAEIRTPVHRGWAHGRFLEKRIDIDIASDSRVEAVVGGLADAMAGRGDLRPYVSRRGLHVAYWNTPIRFDHDDLGDIMRDDAERQWGSNAADREEWPWRTFAEAVADPFVSVWADADRIVRYNEPIEGPNGVPAEYAVPEQFTNFPFIAAHDPGDEDRFHGIDWLTWNVYLTYEDGSPKVIGLNIDAWAP